jgi:hypothetical protein
MTGRIIGSGSKTRYLIDNKEVTEAEFDLAFPPKPIHSGDDLAIGWHKPVLSDALAVHPKQIPEAMARDKKHGLNIEYTPDGRPILTSQAQKRKMIRSLNYHENNCYS